MESAAIFASSFAESEAVFRTEQSRVNSEYRAPSNSCIAISNDCCGSMKLGAINKVLTPWTEMSDTNAGTAPYKLVITVFPSGSKVAGKTDSN